MNLDSILQVFDTFSRLKSPYNVIAIALLSFVISLFLIYLIVKTIKKILESVHIQTKLGVFNGDNLTVRKINELESLKMSFGVNENKILEDEQDGYRRKLLLRHNKKAFKHYVLDKIKSPLSDKNQDVHEALRLQGVTSAIANTLLSLGTGLFFVPLIVILVNSLSNKHADDLLPVVGLLFGLVAFGITALIYRWIQSSWLYDMIKKQYREYIQKIIDSQGFEHLPEKYQQRAFHRMLKQQEKLIPKHPWFYTLTGVLMGISVPLIFLADVFFNMKFDVVGNVTAITAMFSLLFGGICFTLVLFKDTFSTPESSKRIKTTSQSKE